MARRFGYSRVSTSDQDWSLQLEALTKAGVDDRDIFREKASGAKRDRTELRRMLDLLRPGDQATVYRLDRLARSKLHLLKIIEEIEKGRKARVADGQHRHGHGNRKDGGGRAGGSGRVRAQLADGALRRWGEDRAATECPVRQAPETHPQLDPS